MATTKTTIEGYPGTLEEFVEERVAIISHELESRAYRAGNELRNASAVILSGPRHGRQYNVPGVGRVKYDKKKGKAKIIYKKYTASAPGEAPAVRTGIFRLSWQPRSFSKETEKGKILHSVIESDYRTAKGHLLGEILENGTKNGHIQPRPYKEQTKAKAMPGILRIYREPYF